MVTADEELDKVMQSNDDEKRIEEELLALSSIFAEKLTCIDAKRKRYNLDIVSGLPTEEVICKLSIHIPDGYPSTLLPVLRVVEIRRSGSK